MNDFLMNQIKGADSLGACSWRRSISKLLGRFGAQLLGIRASKAEIAAMLAKAGADESSELDPEAFTRIMTEVLTKSDAAPTTAAPPVRGRPSLRSSCEG